MIIDEDADIVTTHLIEIKNLLDEATIDFQYIKEDLEKLNAVEKREKLEQIELIMYNIIKIIDKEMEEVKKAPLVCLRSLSKRRIFRVERLLKKIFQEMTELGKTEEFQNVGIRYLYDYDIEYVTEAVKRIEESVKILKGEVNS